MKKTILTVDISEELESKIEKEAKRNRVSKDEFVRIVLEQKLNSQSSNFRQPPFEAKIIATDVPIKDRSRENDWLAKHQDEYDGQWVALDGDTLIAAGFEAKEVTKKVRAVGINGIFLVFVEGSKRPRFISGGIWRE